MMDDPRKATGMAAGCVGAVVILIVHAFAFFQIDLTAEVIIALTALLTAGAGFFVHGAREDFEALHARILAKLREDHSPVIAPPPTAPLRPIFVGDHEDSARGQK